MKKKIKSAYKLQVSVLLEGKCDKKLLIGNV